MRDKHGVNRPCCAYCGHRCRDGKTTCGYHADLIELDDLSIVEDYRESFKVWWRDRYTMAEITALAGWLDSVNDHRGRRVALEGSPTPADTEGF